MKPKNVLIFGASGQIGRHIIRKLTKNNYKVTAVTRNIHQKGYILKTQAPAGWIDCVEANIFDENKLVDLISKSDICINLVGILSEGGKINTFENIHTKFPFLLSKICKEKGVEQFIHLSALGIEDSKDSFYAKSKLEGEKVIKKNFPNSIILRPSVIYSVDDNFTTNFMTLLSHLPFFPIFKDTKFEPIHVSDLTEIIFYVMTNKIKSITIECVGNEVISMRQILEKLLKLIGKKRLLIPLPFNVSKIVVTLFGLLPNPPITKDQLNLLKIDNVQSGKYKTNFDLGVPSICNFELEVEKYCAMWRNRGQYSKKNFN
tara:strand:- start:144 stop:1094 length:951 start_codon:yes stop_codon:yes gene_type:complete